LSDVEALAVRRCWEHVGNAPRRTLGRGKKEVDRMFKNVRIKRMFYTLGWLAAMALAIGAPFKNKV
jgi:hypothetical protein